jgi:hypothetical protein
LRTSKYGRQYWVSAHTVERDDWDRSSSERSNLAQARLIELAAYGSFTARFVNPNARCPVCGDSVFFYQNKYGSRVYFDELGPPWPKHPCTDNKTYLRRRFSKPHEPIYPKIRDSNAIAEISNLYTELGVYYGEHFEFNRSEMFKAMYGANPWPAWTIRRMVKLDAGALFVASPIDTSNQKLLYLITERVPRYLTDGDCFFFKKDCAELLSPKSLKPIQITLQKLSGPKEFISKMIQ